MDITTLCQIIRISPQRHMDGARLVIINLRLLPNGVFYTNQPHPSSKCPTTCIPRFGELFVPPPARNSRGHSTQYHTSPSRQRPLLHRGHHEPSLRTILATTCAPPLLLCPYRTRPSGTDLPPPNPHRSHHARQRTVRLVGVCVKQPPS